MVDQACHHPIMACHLNNNKEGIFRRLGLVRSFCQASNEDLQVQDQVVQKAGLPEEENEENLQCSSIMVSNSNISIMASMIICGTRRANHLNSNSKEITTTGEITAAINFMIHARNPISAILNPKHRPNRKCFRRIHPPKKDPIPPTPAAVVIDGIIPIPWRNRPRGTTRDGASNTLTSSSEKRKCWADGR